MPARQGRPNESVTTTPTVRPVRASNRSRTPVADEIAGAAELVMGKIDGIPGAIVRGLDIAGEGTAQELVISAEQDLFR